MADYLDNSGYLDAMGAPQAFQHWTAKNSQRFKDQMGRHVNKSDFGVVDLTGANPAQVKEVMSHYQTLPQKDKLNLIVIQETSAGIRILN